MPDGIRLNLYLARAGVASRRGADALIEGGHVRLNGAIVREHGLRVRRDDRVEVDGRLVGGSETLTHFLLHKPPGVVTTARDPAGRPTVLSLLPARGPRLFPVGRLDIDSEGLLFLMNDGKLAHRLTHPRYEVAKTYRVWTERTVDAASRQELAAGVLLEDGMTAPAVVTTVRAAGAARRGSTSAPPIDITLHEGRNRQVRRMLEAVGHTVIRLVRIRFGSVPLGDLPPGAHRPLTRAEVDSLRRLVRLTDA